jgi:hypothetical protein
METRHYRAFAAPRLLATLLALSVLANVIIGASALDASGHLPFVGSDRARATQMQPSLAPAEATARAESIATWWAARYDNRPVTDDVHFYYHGPGPQDGGPDR